MTDEPAMNYNGCGMKKVRALELFQSLSALTLRKSAARRNTAWILPEIALSGRMTALRMNILKVNLHRQKSHRAMIPQ